METLTVGAVCAGTIRSTGSFAFSRREAGRTFDTNQPCIADGCAGRTGGATGRTFFRCRFSNTKPANTLLVGASTILVYRTGTTTDIILIRIDITLHTDQSGIAGFGAVDGFTIVTFASCSRRHTDPSACDGSERSADLTRGTSGLYARLQTTLSTRSRRGKAVGINTNIRIFAGAACLIAGGTFASTASCDANTGPRTDPTAGTLTGATGDCTGLHTGPITGAGRTPYTTGSVHTTAFEVTGSTGRTFFARSLCQTQLFLASVGEGERSTLFSSRTLRAENAGLVAISRTRSFLNVPLRSTALERKCQVVLTNTAMGFAKLTGGTGFECIAFDFATGVSYALFSRGTVAVFDTGRAFGHTFVSKAELPRRTTQSPRRITLFDLTAATSRTKFMVETIAVFAASDSTITNPRRETGLSCTTAKVTSATLTGSVSTGPVGAGTIAVFGTGGFACTKSCRGIAGLSGGAIEENAGSALPIATGSTGTGTITIAGAASRRHLACPCCKVTPLTARTGKISGTTLASAGAAGPFWCTAIAVGDAAAGRRLAESCRHLALFIGSTTELTRTTLAGSRATSSRWCAAIAVGSAGLNLQTTTCRTFAAFS